MTLSCPHDILLNHLASTYDTHANMTNYTRSELIFPDTLRKTRKRTVRVSVKNIRDDYSSSRLDDVRFDITRQSVVRNSSYRYAFE